MAEDFINFMTGTSLQAVENLFMPLPFAFLRVRGNGHDF
jgi:hypothetical protein